MNLRRFVHWMYQHTPKKLRSRIVRTLTPNYTLGAVVIAVCTVRSEGAQYLLLLRKHREENWCLPGGLVGRGEATRHAAVRELGEETGVDVEESTLTPAYPSCLVYPRIQQLDCIFLARLACATSAELPSVRLDSAEMREGQWWTLRDIADLPPLTRATEQLLRRISLTSVAGVDSAYQVDV